METIKKGSRGDSVKVLQICLGLMADGIFGNDTESKLKDYQKSKGLGVDGVCGKNTWQSFSVGGARFEGIPVHISMAKRKVEYIVIHYTAGGSSKAGSAMRNRDVFLSRSASADFVVDDEEIVQVNPDLNRCYCWSVGDGKGKYGITNLNSVSIEMCSTLKKGASSATPNHSGWTVSEEVLSKTISLVKVLMDIFGLPSVKVVRHYDASGKYCPGFVGWNNGILYDEQGKKIGQNNSDQWITFKKRIS